jgi:hypothetical protein
MKTKLPMNPDNCRVPSVENWSPVTSQSLIYRLEMLSIEKPLLYADFLVQAAKHTAMRIKQKKEGTWKY